MIKVVFGWKDNPDLSPEECEVHYREVHMDLARECFADVDGFHALVYNRVRSHAVNNFNDPTAVPRDPDLDAFVELFMADQDSMDRAFANPQMTRMFEDHQNFMATDIPANVRIYHVDEDVFFGRRPG